jgi:tetraacyldisaccharide-1-P 4'-kinase
LELSPFPDHHHYDTLDLEQIASRAKQLSAEVVLTTQKDLVKISADLWKGPPLFAVEVGTEFVSGQEYLETMLTRCFEQNNGVTPVP